MFNPFKRKEEKEIDDPPDEVNGKVEFCSPTIPSEAFRDTDSIDNFINKIKKENGENS